MNLYLDAERHHGRQPAPSDTPKTDALYSYMAAFGDLPVAVVLDKAGVLRRFAELRRLERNTKGS